MITNLKIENFKGIKKLEFSDFKRYNILIGKNDASKSTVLEAIFAFKATMVKPQENFSRVIRSTHRQQHARELWHEYATAIDPTINLMFNGLNFNLRFHSTFDFNFVDVILQIQDKPDCRLKMASLMNQVQRQENENMIAQLEGATSKYFSDMMFFDELYRLRVQDWETEILKRNLSPVDIYSKNSGSSMTDYIGDQSRLMLGTGASGRFIDTFGEGRKSGIALLTLAKGLENSVILVEEIETHQHPESLRNLILELIKICNEKNNQLFITTHSPEVLQIFSVSEDTKLYHLQKSEMNEQTVNIIDPSDIRMIRDVGWHIGNILAFEKFVLVEGELDKKILEEVFYKIRGYWPEELGINFVMCGGYTNQKEILKAVAFPEKNIFVQRDYDEKSKTDIENEVFAGFKELEQQGFMRSEDLEKIELHKNGIRKIIKKNHIIVTGLPNIFTNISKHATDDYILEILQKEPQLLSLFPTAKNTIPTSQFTNSKEILNDILGGYDSIKAIKILKECSIESISDELRMIVVQIESS